MDNKMLHLLRNTKGLTKLTRARDGLSLVKQSVSLI